MNLSAPLLGLVGSVAGVVTAVAGYQLVTADLPEAGASESGAPVAVGQSAEPDNRKVAFERCTPPAELRGGVCVTHKWRTVVVDGPSAPSVAAPSVAASPSPSEVANTVASRDRDSLDDHDGDRDEFGDDDDHADDHGEDRDDDGEDRDEPDDENFRDDD